jgi:hypothetical protein
MKLFQSSAHLAKQLQRRRLLEIGQTETTIVCGDHVCQRIGMKCAIVIEDLTIHILIFSSETPQPTEVKLSKKHLWKVLDKISSFHTDWTKNMVAMGNSN